MTEQHAGIRHRTAGSDFTFTLAVARWKKDDELFWRHAFVAHEGRRPDAGAVMARPRLKGGKEQLFKEVLRGLDLHHPPGASLTAHRKFYALGALACNLMKAVPILCLPEDCQSWTVPTLLKARVRLPATLVGPARRLVARVAVAESWLDWWRRWPERWWRAGAVESVVPSG